jgi:hypothetical protein
LSLCLQLIEDFKKDGGDDSAESRSKLISFLEIDCYLRRAELYKQAPDYESALEDLANVEQLCIRFPDKNEATLISAIF